MLHSEGITRRKALVEFPKQEFQNNEKKTIIGMHVCLKTWGSQWVVEGTLGLAVVVRKHTILLDACQNKQEDYAV
jgi:hypothetical protein